MIWFNLKKLETQLVNDKVSEKSSFQYLIVYLFIMAFAFSLPEEQEFSHIGWEIGGLIAGLLITITGTYLAFSINSRGNNTDFLKRYLSLSFVHSTRLIVVLLILRLTFKVFMHFISLDLWHIFNDLFSGDLGQLLYPLVTSLVFYVLLIGSFKRVNGAFTAKEVAA